MKYSVSKGPDIYPLVIISIEFKFNLISCIEPDVIPVFIDICVTKADLKMLSLMNLYLGCCFFFPFGSVYMCVFGYSGKKKNCWYLRI